MFAKKSLTFVSKSRSIWFKFPILLSALLKSVVLTIVSTHICFAGDYFPFDESIGDELFIDLHSSNNLPYFKWIKNYNKCKPSIEKMRSLLIEYGESNQDDSAQSSSNIHSEIQNLLKSDVECRESTWLAYLVGSLSLGPYVTPDTNPFPDHIVIQGRAPKGYLKNELTLLVLALGNQGLIQPLTSSSRNQLSVTTGHSLWNEKNEGRYKIVGYYDCLNTSIFIDDTLKPFNTAASLYHEISHFYQDRIGFSHYFATPWEPGKSIAQFIAYEELRATVYGAFWQKSLFHNGHGELRPYSHPGFDLDFFQSKGPLSRIYESLNVEIGTNSSTFLHSYLNVHSPSESSLSNNLSPEEQDICSLYRIIYTGYFGTTPDCNKLEFPMGTWWGDLDSRLNLVRGNRQKGDVKNSLSFYQHILEEIKDNPQSWVCLEIVDHQKSGKLKSYMGTQLTQGAKGGNEGIRPCLRVKF